MLDSIRYESNKAKAKEMLERGFSSQSKKQECLDYINSAFDAISWELQKEILEERNQFEENSKGYKEIENLYYGCPHSCYLWKEKVSVKYEKYKYCQLLNELKKLYDEAKAAEVIKIILTPQQKKSNEIKLALDSENGITDKIEYMNQVNKMIESLEKVVKKLANEKADYFIKYLKMPENEIKVLCEDKSFEKMYNSFLRGNNEENLRNYFNYIAEMTLLDTKIRIIKTVKYDITQTKLLNYSESFQQWEINNDKIFEIEAITAGGWNVQCFHIRTITKLKNRA